MRDFPGHLGWTSQGVFAIHADWPAYPAEHGPEVALAGFGMFPQGTTFAAIDDIDRCILFLAQGQSDAEVLVPPDERNFHVAAWHEDLLDLADRYLLQGIHRITELTWRINHDRALAKVLDPVRSSAEGMAKGAPKFFYELPDRNVPRSALAIGRQVRRRRTRLGYD